MVRLAVFVGACALLLAQAAEGSIVDAIKRETQEVSNEIVQRMLLGSMELQQLMGEVKTSQTVNNLNSLDGCSILFDDLEKGENLIKESYEMGAEVVKSFLNGTEGLIKCVDLDFVKMGKCIINDIKNLKQLIAISKAGALSYEEDFKRLGGQIKAAWLQCIGKATTTTPAPITTAGPITTSTPTTPARP